MQKFRYLVALAVMACGLGVQTAEAVTPRPPRLVINLVVGSMRAEDIGRYSENFSDGGFKKLSKGGVNYLDARYNYQQTTTPTSLATLTTGAQPSTHGVIAAQWRDYVANKLVSLIDNDYQPSVKNIVAPTLASTILDRSPKSRVVSIAVNPVPSVVMSGGSGEVYWMDSMDCAWRTSTEFAESVPEWVSEINNSGYSQSFVKPQWMASKDKSAYVNCRAIGGVSFEMKKRNFKPDPNAKRLNNTYAHMTYTPAGNSVVMDFAKSAVVHSNLGKDDCPDLLNIYLDPSTYINQFYGPESVEVEDMYYRLDRDVANLLEFVEAQIGNDYMVVLTSDHGTSPSYDFGDEEADRFNVRQFEVIVNGFLNVRYGSGKWVMEYEDCNIYLDHNLIYEKGLSLADVQNEVAIFAMQFRGVSHALSSTAMRMSYFGSGYAQKMQNSFYPRRSGDVVINLMPGWIEKYDNVRSKSGSMYGYDSNVPLIFFGKGLLFSKVGREVDLTSLAPTLARIVGVNAPAASEGSVLREVVE